LDAIGLRQLAENNSEIVTHFSQVILTPSSHHIHHAIHHDLTTIKPPAATQFSQKSPQKRISTTSEKKLQLTMIFASNHHGVAHPTARKKTSLLQPTHVLHHPRHHRRLYHIVSNLPPQP
jgi:hypothetical protein